MGKKGTLLSSCSGEKRGEQHPEGEESGEGAVRYNLEVHTILGEKT